MHWSSSIQANNKMQPREQKAHMKLEQEIHINGQPINSFERQDSINPVGASWPATVSFGAVQEMAAKARGASTVVAIILTPQVCHNLETFKLAVAPHTWEDEMTSLLSSSLGQHVAHLVWDRQFQTMKGKLFSCSIAGVSLSLDSPS